MKKLKWFTLVEILIVIVIIWILIWALVPRLQWTQWRARDVARKNDLSQIQTSVLTSFQDKWHYPDYPNWQDVATGDLKNLLEWAWLSTVPSDPLKQNIVEWVWSSAGAAGQYRYIRTKRNSKNWAWFFLVARTESEWASNWVYCGGKWAITSGTDSKTWKQCETIKKVPSNEPCVNEITNSNGGVNESADLKCSYNNENQLRYVLAY